MYSPTVIAAVIRRVGRTKKAEMLGRFCFTYEDGFNPVCRYIGEEPGTDFVTGEVVWYPVEGVCRFAKKRVDLCALNLAEKMNKEAKTAPWAAQ